MTNKELGAKYSELRKKHDDLQSELSAIKNEMDEIEDTMLKGMVEGGSEPGDAFKCNGLSFTLREKNVVGYEPEHWEGICKFAVENGFTSMIQRRINEKVALELMMDGRAPEGLKLTTIKRLEVRKA
jgi:hypothetical protein